MIGAFVFCSVATAADRFGHAHPAHSVHVFQPANTFNAPAPQNQTNATHGYQARHSIVPSNSQPLPAVAQSRYGRVGNYRYVNQSQGAFGPVLGSTLLNAPGILPASTYGLPDPTTYGLPASGITYPTYASGPINTAPSEIVRQVARASNGGAPVAAEIAPVPLNFAKMSIDVSSLNPGQRGYVSVAPRPTDPVPGDQPTPADWHRRLRTLLSRRLVKDGTEPHTRLWLNKHDLLAPWGYRLSDQWAWGTPGVAALEGWLGDHWNKNSASIVFYDANQVQPPYPVAVYAADECLAMGNQQPAIGSKWMPLGVFGLLPPRVWSYVMTMQLAANTDGIIRGYAVDTETKRVSEIRGAIDRETLRVAFTICGDEQRKFETSAADLLQPESLVNVYQSADQTLASWDVFRDNPR